MDMTLSVMAHSLVYWTQDLVARELLGRGSRIFSMTSEGSHRVVPNYGAVSAARRPLSRIHGSSRWSWDRVASW